MSRPLTNLQIAILSVSRSQLVEEHLQVQNAPDWKSSLGFGPSIVKNILERLPTPGDAPKKAFWNLQIVQATVADVFNCVSTKKVSILQSYFHYREFYGSIMQSVHSVNRAFEEFVKLLRPASQEKTAFFVSVFDCPARELYFERCRDKMNFS